jgi:hypothetical protein
METTMPARSGGQPMKRTILFAILSVTLHLVAVSNSWAADVPFDSQQVIYTTTGNSAPSIVTVDLDGDGDLDVVSTTGGWTVAWHENTDGAGTFGSQNLISTALNTCREVYSADLDGDGDPDVLSADSSDDTIAWYENRLNDGINNDFNPTQLVISTAADGAWSVFAADLDSDGDLDVLSASYDDDTIAWYENRLNDGINNDFNPTQQVISTTAVEAASVFTGDLDGDGDQDVLSASYGDDTIAWYENRLNDGINNDFTTQQVISTAADGASSVHAADLDGDGDLDVLSASNTDDKIAWYENRLNDGINNDFNPAQKVISTTADLATSVSATDVDGDGDMDVLSSSRIDDKIAWYENTTGTGIFSTEKVIDAFADEAMCVTTGDVDGDGDLDVLSSSRIDMMIVWYENLSIHRSALIPQQSIISTVADFPVDIIASDVDGDGDMDALAAFNNDNLIAWYENISCNPLAFSPHSISSAAMGAQSVYVADIDRDGHLDVLSASQADDKIAWYKNNGLAVFGAPNVISTSADGASAVFAVDVDGDGDVDALSASQSNGEIVWYESDGAYPPAFTDHLISSLAAGALDVLAIDLDGDGDIDVLSASQGDAGSGKLAWYENTDGAGTFGSQQVVSSAKGLSGVFATDMDRDGDVDLLSTASSDNTVAWHENDGSQNFTEHAISTVASGATSVYASDLDHDGDVDVLSASQSDDKIAWYESDGGSPPVFVERIITQDPDGAGLLQGDADQADTVFVADMDSDGDLDVLSASSLDDKLAYYENLGGQAAFAVVDRAQKVFLNAQVEDLFSIELFHRGRTGDSDAELACLRVLFEDVPAADLTAPQANALFDELRIYLDDGSGSFESGIDILVTTMGTFTGGIETISLTDGDANVQVPFGSTKRFFIVAQMAVDASSQTPDHFEATLLPMDCPNSAEDRLHDIPLTFEPAADVSTARIDTVISTSSCTAPFDLNLANVTVNSARTCQAGTVIRAGTSFVVAAPSGDLTFRAGEGINLMNGFEVESNAAFTAEIDPGLQP